MYQCCCLVQELILGNSRNIDVRIVIALEIILVEISAEYAWKRFGLVTSYRVSFLHV